MYIYMPVSATIGGRSNGVADGSRLWPIGWLNMMRACDARLERFRAAGNGVATASGNGNGETGATEEVATSRKCEGQLSMLCAANSCSSCKPACRTSEMAQEDHGPSWDNLPTVILQEIFSHLSHEARIKASQVYSERM